MPGPKMSGITEGPWLKYINSLSLIFICQVKLLPIYTVGFFFRWRLNKIMM